jgi:transcriptional regulator with XRE-family HTH domain
MIDGVNELKERQIAWLRDMLARHGLKPTPLAERAGVNPSTLTRKLNGTDMGGPFTEATIAKIAAAFGEDYPTLSGGSGGGRSAGFRDTEAEPYVAVASDPLADAIRHLCDRPGVDPWTLHSRALEYEGYRPGDIMIVDLNAEPRRGDVVCAQLYDWQRPGGTQTVFRLFEPPYLVGAGPDEASRKPRLIDNDSVAIKGVVLTSLRPRASRAA